MKNEAVLCIDFGSAYTKIALRSDWNEGATLIRGTPLSPVETNFCIPSAVARVESKGGARWAFGEAAAQQRPGDGITIYRHWKARLLSEQAGTREVEEYDDVATAFFRELKEQLDRMTLSVELTRCPLRICIPKLNRQTETAEQRVTKVVGKAGWRLAENRPIVYEPESNACGVFTRGRNATWFPQRPLPSKERYPYYLDMFDRHAGLLAAIRRGDARYGVLVIDVGAFTTDFSFIEFDTDETQRPSMTQLSREIGVSELDRSIEQRMRPIVKRAILHATTNEWEKAKRLLYNSTPAAIVNPDGGVLTIGEGVESNTIAETVDEFATRVVNARQEFCGQYVNRPISAQILTGGGAMIPLVRDALINVMKTTDGIVYDLLDADESKSALLMKRGPSGWYYDEKEVEARLGENQDLVRGASAIGGCSIFFE